MSENPRELPPPDPARPPLQANVFHAVRHANTKLMPMFPYGEDGSLIPGASVFLGGPGQGIGAFNHENSVDEVAIAFVCVGSGIRSGDVFVGAREHLVGAFFNSEEAAENLMVIVVVQRQTEAGIAQMESLSFICEKCQSQLSTRQYSAKRIAETQSPDSAPPLETLTEGAVWASDFNQSEERRTCGNCGHVNPPFPLHVWGWDSYNNNYIAAEKARGLYLKQVVHQRSK